jgi:hypothetical protein
MALDVASEFFAACILFVLMQWCMHQQVHISKYDPATRTKGIGVGRYDSICRSHRIDCSDLRRGDPSGSRTAWRSALRGRRRSLWWWWRRGCGPAHCTPSRRSTSSLRAQLCAPSFHTTFLGACPVHHPSWAAAFRSTGAPAPVTRHSRPSGLRAVPGISPADSQAHESNC